MSMRVGVEVSVGVGMWVRVELLVNLLMEMSVEVRAGNAQESTGTRSGVGLLRLKSLRTSEFCSYSYSGLEEEVRDTQYLLVAQVAVVVVVGLEYDVM